MRMLLLHFQRIINCIVFFLWYGTAIIWNSCYKTGRQDWMRFSLFAIKNRYKISLYKYTREMQHVVNPSPTQKASNCGGVTNIWKDRIIQRNNTFTCTARTQLHPQLSCESWSTMLRSLLFTLWTRCGLEILHLVTCQESLNGSTLPPPLNL